MAITHAQIWAALDALAARLRLSPSGLAKAAGLDPTSFNRSKRHSNDTPPRPRWPSTESLAKVLNATGVSLADFAALAEPRARQPAVAGFAEAGTPPPFGDDFPVVGRWDVVDLSAWRGERIGLLVSDGSAEPILRVGDRIFVEPVQDELEPGDRAVIRFKSGPPFAGIIEKTKGDQIVIRTFWPMHDLTIGALKTEIAWRARLIGAVWSG